MTPQPIIIIVKSILIHNFTILKDPTALSVVFKKNVHYFQIKKV